MWERETGYCENCAHYKPKIDDCIGCYVEKLTRKSRDFMINGNEVDSREATKLAGYLKELGIFFYGRTKKDVAQ